MVLVRLRGVVKVLLVSSPSYVRRTPSSVLCFLPQNSTADKPGYYPPQKSLQAYSVRVGCAFILVIAIPGCA